MNVLIVTDQRVVKVENKYYTESAFSYVLERYKKAFGTVTLFAKTGTAVSHSSVELSNITIYESGSNLDVYLGRNKKRVKRIIKGFDLVVLRLPSVLGYQVAKIARKERIPYLTEVMGCAWDQLWNHGFIGKVLAPIMFIRMKKAIRKANYSSYVTNSFLQKRYPCQCESLSASNVRIDSLNETVAEKRKMKIDSMDSSHLTLMTAGGVNVRYKGFQYVIKAIPLLNRKGIKVNYLIVGSGDNSYLKRIAIRFKVLDQVTFVGSVSRDNVLTLMDDADIYIQPSLQEGLPRTVIEAMSRACPACGARTAGIPELLDKRWVFKRKSANAIANCLVSIFNKDALYLASQRNYFEASNYLERSINERRYAYYCNIKKTLQSLGVKKR